MNKSPDPLKPLKNQKALVTGANSGIGEACALAPGAAGADVVVNYVLRPEESGARREKDTAERHSSDRVSS